MMAPAWWPAFIRPFWQNRLYAFKVFLQLVCPFCGNKDPRLLSLDHKRGKGYCEVCAKEFPLEKSA